MRSRYRMLRIGAACAIAAALCVCFAASYTRSSSVHRDADETQSTPPSASRLADSATGAAQKDPAGNPPPFDPNTSIAGIVSDERGELVAGAELMLSMRPPSERSWQTKSAADGSFVFTELPEGIFSILAMHDKHYPYRQEELRAGEISLALVLKNMAFVSGRVLSARTAVPITEFEILAFQQQAPCGYPDEIAASELWKDVSHPEGRFECDGIPHGHPYIVAARAEGYAMEFIEAPALDPGTNRDDIVFRLQPGLELQGVVVDEAGAPIKAAEIAALADPKDRPHWQTESDADGLFSLNTVSREAKFLCAKHPDYLLGTIPISPAPGVTPSVTITLGTPAVVRGRVSRGGQPEAMAQVLVGPELGADVLPAMRGPFGLDTNSEGFYEAKLVVPGPMRVMTQFELGEDAPPEPLIGSDSEVINMEGNGHDCIWIERHVIARKGEVTQVDFDLPGKPSVLEGSVELDGEAPASLSVCVELNGPLGQAFRDDKSTGEAGRFVIDNLYSGTGILFFNLRKQEDTWIKKRVEIRIGEGERIQRHFSFRLGPAVNVRLVGLRDDENVAIVEAFDSSVPPGKIRNMHDVDDRFFDRVTNSDELQGDVITLKGLEANTRYTLAAIAANVAQPRQSYNATMFHPDPDDPEPRVAAIAVTTRDEEMNIEITLPEAEQPQP